MAPLLSCGVERLIMLCNFRWSTKYDTFTNENVLTRMGKSAKFMDRDPGQVDLPRRTICLKEALVLKMLKALVLFILMIRTLCVIA
jgi:hypothetical protein